MSIIVVSDLLSLKSMEWVKSMIGRIEALGLNPGERETLWRAVLYAMGLEVWEDLAHSVESCEELEAEVKRAKRLRERLGDEELSKILEEYVKGGEATLELCREPPDDFDY